ncbi:MAG: hypothetical protein HC799_20065 [Limnothrix sp. RL_2_0]|nr:hypothetical protein [Limnothrix sp. RL_2_0]
MKKILQARIFLAMYFLGRKSPFHGKAAVCWGLACGVFITTFQSNEIKHLKIDAVNLSAEDRPAEAYFKSDVELKETLTLLRYAPSLGFRNVLANGVFLNFLQYFSDISSDVSKHNDVGQNLSPEFFEAIISLDPFYKEYYLFLSSSTTLYAAQPQKTIALMARGLEKMDPNLMHDSFYIWRYKGVDELLFLGDGQSAKHSFEKAAEWASRSDEPDSDLIEMASRRTAAFLAADPESRYAQIAAWSSVLSHALNDTIRKRAIERIEELGGSVDLQESDSVRIDSAHSHETLLN